MTTASLRPFDGDPAAVWRPEMGGQREKKEASSKELTRVFSVLDDSMPITQAATAILLAIVSFRRMAAVSDVGLLRQKMIEAVKQFEQSALDGKARQDDVIAARYLLCCALDEAISIALTHNEEDWSAGSLLVTFHNESWGGDKAFALIDRLRHDRRRYEDLLQLSLFILALGFEGRYRLLPNGSSQLDELRSSIARDITVRRNVSSGRSQFTQNALMERRKRKFYVPLWFSFASTSMLIIGFLYAYFLNIDSQTQSAIKTIENTEYSILNKR